MSCCPKIAPFLVYCARAILPEDVRGNYVFVSSTLPLTDKDAFFDVARGAFRKVRLTWPTKFRRQCTAIDVDLPFPFVHRKDFSHLPGATLTSRDPNLGGGGQRVGASFHLSASFLTEFRKGISSQGKGPLSNGLPPLTIFVLHPFAL